jgi:hypothetical protein
LLDNPRARWLPGHIEVEDAPPVMSDDEKAVEHAKGQCWHGKEIHRGDGFTVIPQECIPSL